MTIPVKDQLRYWGIGLAVLVVILWLFSGVMLPYVAGAAIAYFLDPVADRLERMGCSRVIATLIITFIAVIVFVVAALVLVPSIINQLNALVTDAPLYSSKFQAFLQDKIPSLMEPDSALRQTLDSIGQTLREREIGRAHV